MRRLLIDRPRMWLGGVHLAGRWHRPLRVLITLALIAGLVPVVFNPGATEAASVTAASFSGGAGTATVGSTLYARNGGVLTLNVTTSADTQCVVVANAFSASQTSTAKSSWLFSFTAGAGDGIRTANVTAYRNTNCTAQPGTGSASFVLDNTGPTVTGALSPAPNAAGWNNSNVSISWSATDGGSGVASGPTPATDSVSANTGGVTRSSTATDRLGNTGTGSVTVKLDKAAPTIGASRNPAANSFGWNNTDVTVSFTCGDSLSGIKSCPPAATLGSEGANQSASGTAVDNADNTASASVTGINIDKTAPTLSGAPTTGPNAAGWYKGDVTITWSCGDALAGIAGACPAASTISSEGTSLTASATVSDRASNSTTATSSPAVKIDKTAPVTLANAPASWNNSDVTVVLTANDALAGVKATYYTLDGGAQQTGTSLTISSEGQHTLIFWSEDNAGNVESAKTVSVKIDKTPPAINHSQNPPANADGWNNTTVTVTFTCSDSGGSGIASCTAPQVMSAEGQNQPVTGTAIDHAGNSATDPATVSIDLTKPTISAVADRPANANGWYKADVTVTFTCGDALSGIKSCSDPVTLGEGANQSASGTATDAAGNSQSVTLGGLNIDKTAPTISGSASGPLTNGWYTGDVTVQWTCVDTLSGIDGSCPTDSLVTGEGASLAASATISDRAGNSTTGVLSGLKIDRTAPNTLISLPAPIFDGWYQSAIQIELNASDPLSGVAKTYYRIDGGAPQEYSGSFSHGLSGIHTITFWSVDQAGNIEDQNAPGHSVELKIDDVAPTITGSQSPATNGHGWNSTDVIVSFVCSDSESGIAVCTDMPTTVTTEGANQPVDGLAQDQVGNQATATVKVNIDKTAPTLTGVPTTSPNAAGWYKGNVTVSWTGQDGLSGIDPATQPANSIISGEGSNLGAGPVSIADKAGNSGSGSISGIKIDRTPPSISGQTVNDNGTPRSPNSAGWFSSDVRVRFSCTDALSGIQECASDVVLNTNGNNLSANGTATDMADNSATTTVGGIKIDSLAPQTSANNVCTGQNGWCRGQTATVTLTAVDQAGLSGVKEIRYRINGAGWQSKPGASTSVIVPLAARSGLATVEFQAVDNAGNIEPLSGVSLKYDNIAPAVTHTVSPAPNADGWNKTSVTVHFDATDDDGGSGVDPGTVTPDQTLTAETPVGGQVVNGQAYDLAGNQGTDSVTVKIDKTPPTISGVATTSPNANGWYKGPVTIHFTCSDALSGIATCPADVVLTSNGAGQSASGTAIDLAGNTASATVSGINIDAVAPVITSTGVQDGGIYTLGSVPTAVCTATDGGSGLVSCTITVTGGLANGVGPFSFTATATDKAGNTTTVSGRYRVIYRWDGYLQPINDTAHQIGQDISIFKGGSTVPAKFQLKSATGTPLQANSLPEWLTPVRGSLTTAAIDESLYSDGTTNGNTYRWDTTAQQYIYNWGTRGATTGYFYRIGVKLDDGQTYYVNIGLR